MKKSPEGVNVSIMGREFAVVCADDQRDALSLAAMHLDTKMHRSQGQRIPLIVGANNGKFASHN